MSKELDPIVVNPEKDLNVESSDEDVLRTAKGEGGGNAEPIVGNPPRKQIVNTILVKEVKYLIAKAIEEILPKLGFKTDVVDELPAVGENGVIYFVPNGGENPNVYDEYVWVSSTSSFEKIGSTELPLNYVTTDTEQTITGIKTFPIGTKIKIDDNYYYSFTGENFGQIGFKRNGQYGIILDGDTIRNIGSLNKGNITLTIADISNGLFNVINASDIVNNTLTQVQYDLITNGKPTIILGTYLGHKNMIITYWIEYSTTWRALAIAECTVFSIMLNTTSKALTEGGTDLSLKAISRFNDKAIPSFPTTNATPQFIQIGANGGALSYNDPFTPTSVSISDGGTISDTTLQADIQYHRPIVLNGFTCYFSCDDGTNYQYVSTRYDSSANKNHINVITINKSTWVATFHTSDLALS